MYLFSSQLLLQDVRVLGDEFNCTEVDSDLDLHSTPTDSLHVDEDNVTYVLSSYNSMLTYLLFIFI